MTKSPEEMRRNMIEQLQEKTGKSFPEWLKLIRAEKFIKHGEIMKFLKGQHGLTHGLAGYGAGIDGRPAHCVLALNQRHMFAKFRRLYGPALPARARTDHNDVKMLHRLVLPHAG